MNTEASSILKLEEQRSVVAEEYMYSLAWSYLWQVGQIHKYNWLGGGGC